MEWGELDDAQRKLAERAYDAAVSLRRNRRSKKHLTAFDEAQAALAQGPVLVVGEVLDHRFVLMGKASDEGLASRWRAQDLESDALCCVWVMHPQYLSDPSSRARFEAGAIQQSETAQALPILAQVASHRGFLWYASEHVPQTLAEAVEAGLDRIGGMQAIVDLAEVLAALHESGSVHGAVDPAMVSYGEDGVARLGGFQHFAAGMRSLYVAPEAGAPGAGEPTAAGDVYAFAMTALYVMYGKPLPFWVLRDPDRLVQEVGLHRELDQVVRLALSWVPEERPTDLSTVVSAVMQEPQVAQELATRAADAGEHGRAEAWYRRMLESADDAEVRLRLAEILENAGNPAAALRERMHALETADDAVAERLLDGLEPSEELVEAVSRRMESGLGPQSTLSLFLARNGKGGSAAWEQAWRRHREPSEALESLTVLVELAQTEEDWTAYTRWGRELAPLLDEEALAALAVGLGHVFLNELADAQNALLWFDRAAGAGCMDARLAVGLERIRSSRGEWPRVRALMEEQARAAEDVEAGEMLRKSARIARYAEHRPRVAETVYQRLLERLPEDPESLRFIARRRMAARDETGALRYFRLLKPHRQEGEPEKNLRDAVSFAKLLRTEGEPEEAGDVVAAVLEAAPGHLPSRELAARWALADGDWDGAENHLRTLVAMGGLDSESQRETLVQLGDLAWLRGEFISASASYQGALDLAPGDPGAWWGLTKVAFCSGTLEEPWMRATPSRFAPQEALARLFASMIDPAAMKAWMAKEMNAVKVAEAMEGRAPLEVAAAVADLLLAKHLVGEALFSRMGDAFPEAEESIERVRRLLCDPPSPDEMFPVSVTYAWAEWPEDFSAKVHRRVLLLGPLPFAFDSGSGWDTLFVAADVLPAAPAQAPPLTPRTPAVRGWLVRGLETPEQQGIQVGDGITSLDGRRGLVQAASAIHRAGTVSYLNANGAEVAVNGWSAPVIRLSHQDSVVIEGAELVYLELPPDEGLPEVELARGALSLDEPTMAPLEEHDARRVGLTYLDAAGAEQLITLSEGLTLDPGGGGKRYRIEREERRWMLRDLSDPDGDLWELTGGDVIDTGTRQYTFRVLERVGPVGVPLLVVDVQGSKEIFVLAQREFWIGRGKDNDLRLRRDNKASRKHCMFEVEAGEVVLIDNNSSNGTLVNGVEVTRCRLKDGDQLEIGDTIVEYRLGPIASDTQEPEVEDIEISIDDGPEELGDDDVMELMAMETTIIRATPRLSVEQGKAKIVAFNSAWLKLASALEDHEEGVAVTELASLLDGTPKVFKPIFEGVPAAGSGVAADVVMLNVVRLDPKTQLPKLSGALSDLLERAIEEFGEEPDDSMTAVLAKIDESGVRASLRSV